MMRSRGTRELALQSSLLIASKALIALQRRTTDGRMTAQIRQSKALNPTATR